MIITSQILLWIAVVILAVLVAALARQVGILYERIAPAGALTLHQQVNVGDIPTEMAVTSLDGQQLTVGGKRDGRSQLLFFTSPDCPVCKSLLPVFKSSVHAEPLGRAFGVAKLPYAVLIDGEGKVASLGLVNTREHLESLFEAKEHGVASLQEFLKRREGEV